MTDERYKAIMDGLGMPQSVSLLGALKQVANEASQEEMARHTLADRWNPIETPPKMAGVYLVANRIHGYVLTARFAPRKGVFIFASAAQSFPVTDWSELPEAPKDQE